MAVNPLNDKMRDDLTAYIKAQMAGREDLIEKLIILQEEGAPDKNYYVNEFGRLQMNAPWYGPEFHRMVTNIEWDDIVIE